MSNLVAGHQALLGGSIDWQPTAENLLAALYRWYTFNDTLADHNGSNDFSQTYGGGITYETSLKGKRLVGYSEMKANASGAVGVDWSMALILNVEDEAANYTGYGYGDFQTFGTDPKAGINFLGTGSAVTASCFIWDTSIPGFVSNGGGYLALPPAPNGSVLVVLKWDESAKTLTVEIQNTAFASVTSAATLTSTFVEALFINTPLGVANDPLRVKPDEWAIWHDYLLTAEDTEYLYNGGSFKSLAEVVADA